MPPSSPEYREAERTALLQASKQTRKRVRTTTQSKRCRKSKRTASSGPLLVAKIELIDSWHRDYSRDTATLKGWRPTEHDIGKKQFMELLRHPTIANAIKQKTVTTTTFTIPDSYILCGDIEYSLDGLQFPDLSQTIIRCIWPVEPKTELDFKSEEEALSLRVVVEKQKEEIEVLKKANETLKKQIGQVNRNFDEALQDINDKEKDLKKEQEKCAQIKSETEKMANQFVEYNKLMSKLCDRRITRSSGIPLQNN